ncbi:MAG: hypothetical protein N3D82_02740 [Ignisphaera sp.]|nr:hypothetical protein [Ignisphaera sp.]MCX8167936.1 hypothetical protein [Ignisphaera sp.]MDW8086251.1 hypothetical protein [Ignisphaera sp.]
MTRERDYLRIEVFLNPCYGRGSARIAFNLANVSTAVLMNAVSMFREFFNSIEYTVDNLSLNVDRSSVEIVLSFISKQKNVKNGVNSPKLKFMAIEGDR